MVFSGGCDSGALFCPLEEAVNVITCPRSLIFPSCPVVLCFLSVGSCTKQNTATLQRRSILNFFYVTSSYFFIIIIFLHASVMMLGVVVIVVVVVF